MDGLITAILAVYAALLSTALGAWTIFRDVTDRGKLRLEGMVGDMVVAGVGVTETNMLILSITNVGRRPIMAKMVCGKDGDQNFFVRFDELPRMVGPGEYVTLTAQSLFILERGFTELYVVDSAGRQHKMTRATMKRLRENYREAMALAKANHGSDS